MDKYPRLFIKASIIYLLLGVLLGLLMAFDLAGGTHRFVHVHFNLFGFMGMMVFGVAYHILPRFNARPLRNPALIPVHFYLGNIGLVGMTFSYMMGGYWQPNFWTPVFHVSAVLSAASILLFGYNMYPVMMDEKETRAGDGDSAAKPSLPPPPPPGSPEADPRPSSLSINRGEKCTKGVFIGDLLAVYPETKKVVEKHYGAGCFSCPGQATETIEQTALMHGIDMDMILSEINAIIGVEHIGK